jgi:hypothetical protein
MDPFIAVLGHPDVIADKFCIDFHQSVFVFNNDTVQSDRADRSHPYGCMTKIDGPGFRREPRL